jgi:hypothetical protein
MRLIISILIISFFSCSESRENKKHLEDSSINTTNINPDIFKVDKGLHENDSANRESYSFIGFIEDFYFSEEPEVYTELYFNRSINTWEEYDSISKLTTELIYQDDENSRNLLSEKVVMENFDVRGLDKLWFFDRSNVQIGTVSHLKSYEFLNQTISPEFIAVYETELKRNQIAYCIGGNKPIFEEIKIQEITDTSITSNISDYFKSNDINTSFTLTHTQYSVNDSIKLTFSNTNDYSFIHLTDNADKLTRVFENEDFSNIVSIQIIPILENGMPTLLCQFLKPETDIFWSEVLVYDNGKYVSADRQRIKTKNR